MFARVPRAERERREQQRLNGWKETPAERERWLRERRRREPAHDVIALYVCELAPFAAFVLTTESMIASTEQGSALYQLVEVAIAELRSAGWQIVDSTVHEKRLPAELGGHRVFDVVFATSD